MLDTLKLSPFRVKPVANLTLTLPNIFNGWNLVTKEESAGPDYAYSRNAARTVGGLMRLGALVDREAEARTPADQLRIDEDPTVPCCLRTVRGVGSLFDVTDSSPDLTPADLVL
jgi:hypothetical protein